MEEVRKDLLDGAVEDDVAIDVAVEAAAVVRLDPLGHAGEKRQAVVVQPGEEAAAGPTGSHPTNRCRLRELAPSSTRCR